jgi:nucleoside-diphosphate-sugar epimerase
MTDRATGALFDRVLITGGAGLIGSHIADRLVEAGASEIVILDDFSRGSLDNLRAAVAGGRVRVVEGDVRDRAVVERAMEGVTLVFHEAGIRITQCAEKPRLANEVLVDGTFNVLEAAARVGVRKVVAASSASVYGLAETFPTAERHHPYANRTLYGAAKLFNEGLLRSFNDMYGLDYIALRYFNVYGPRMDVYGVYTEVLIRWMDAIATGQPPKIFGDGTDSMDFVHVADIARANMLAAVSPLTDAVFNIGSGVETSLNELAAMLLSIMNSSLRPEYKPPRKVNAVSKRQASVDAAWSQLGFRTEIPLEDGLRSLVAWWQEQRSAARS